MLASPLLRPQLSLRIQTSLDIMSARNSYLALIFFSSSQSRIIAMNTLHKISVATLATIAAAFIAAQSANAQELPGIVPTITTTSTQNAFPFSVALPTVSRGFTSADLTPKLRAVGQAFKTITGRDAHYVGIAGIVGVWLDDLNRAATPSNMCVLGVNVKSQEFATYCLKAYEDSQYDQIDAARYGAQFPGRSQVQSLFMSIGLVLIEDGSFAQIETSVLIGQVWTSGDKTITVYSADGLPLPDEWQVSAQADTITRPDYVKAVLVAGSWLGQCEHDNDNTVNLYHNGNGLWSDGSSLPEFAAKVCATIIVAHSEAQYYDAGASH